MVLLVLALASGMVGATGATFNATNSGDGKVGSQALNGPGGTLSAADADNNVNLSWSGTSASSPANGYSVYQASASGNSCTGISSYPTFIGSTTTAGTSVTDSTTVNTGGTSNNAGRWYCYQLVTGYWASGAGSGQAIWQSQVNNVTTPIQAGFFTDAAHLPGNSFLTGGSSATITPPGGSVPPASWVVPTGAIAIGTVFRFFWSAAQTPTAYTGDICLTKLSNTLNFGDAAGSGPCNLTSATPFGALNPGAGAGSLTATGPHDRYAATASWTAGNTELDWTVTNLNGNADSVNAGSSTCTATTHCPPDTDWTFTIQAHTIAVNDTFVITFSGPVSNPAAYSGQVCFQSNLIYFSDPLTSGSCRQYQLGQASGGTLSISTVVRMNATYAWSAGNTVMTVTITNVNGNTENISGAWTFTPGINLVINSGTSSFTFHVNQAASGLITHTPNGQLCLDGTGKKIWFGDSGLGSCNNGATLPLGYLDGSAAGIITAGASDRMVITYTWTTTQLLTVNVTSNAGLSDSVGGTWVFHPAGNNANPGGNSIVTSDATVTLCTTNSGCQPSTS